MTPASGCPAIATSASDWARFMSAWSSKIMPVERRNFGPAPAKKPSRRDRTWPPVGPDEHGDRAPLGPGASRRPCRRSPRPCHCRCRRRAAGRTSRGGSGKVESIVMNLPASSTSSHRRSPALSLDRRTATAGCPPRPALFQQPNLPFGPAILAVPLHLPPRPRTQSRRPFIPFSTADHQSEFTPLVTSTIRPPPGTIRARQGRGPASSPRASRRRNRPRSSPPSPRGPSPEGLATSTIDPRRGPRPLGVRDFVQINAMTIGRDLRPTQILTGAAGAKRPRSQHLD